MSFEPLPGNPDLLHTRAQALINTANTIRDAARDLRSVASDIQTVSKAVDEVREKATEVAEVIVHAETRYRGTGEALQTYSVTLRSAQQRANTAINSADNANSSLQYAMLKRDEYYWIAMGGGPDAEDAATRYTYWNTRVNDLNSNFQDARNQYSGAQEEVNQAAQVAISAIDTAMDNSGLNDGWLDHLRSFWENVIVPGLRLIQNVLDAIAPYLTVLTLIFSVLAVVFPVFAVIAGALRLLSLLHAGLNFATTSGLALAGERSFADVLGAGISLGFAFLAGPIKTFKTAGGPLSFAQTSMREGMSSMRNNFSTVFTRSNWTDLGSSFRTMNFQTVFAKVSQETFTRVHTGAAFDALSSATRHGAMRAEPIHAFQVGVQGVVDGLAKNILIRDPIKWLVGQF